MEKAVSLAMVLGFLSFQNSSPALEPQGITLELFGPANLSLLSSEEEEEEEYEDEYDESRWADTEEEIYQRLHEITEVIRELSEEIEDLKAEGEEEEAQGAQDEIARLEKERAHRKQLLKLVQQIRVADADGKDDAVEELAIKFENSSIRGNLQMISRIGSLQPTGYLLR